MSDNSAAQQAGFCLPVRVYIEDTDAGGIVYYVNYLKFMERARTEYLRALGFGKAFIFEREHMFVVHSLSVDYRAPATLDEDLLVTARPLRLGRTYIEFEQQVLRSGRLLCAGRVKVACVRKDGMRPAAIPGDIRAAVADDSSGNAGFNRGSE